MVNPRSGSCEGRHFTELEKDQYDYKIENGHLVEINIVNIIKSEIAERARSQIYDDLSNLRDENRPGFEMGKIDKIIVAIAGGDGSFMSTLVAMKEYGIDVDRIFFTQLPFGTSNDLGRAFRWGPAPSRKMRRDLKTLATELYFATEDEFNIWEINITTDDHSGDIQWADGKNLTSLGETKLTKLMCHSFSFGLDARVGINFERKRTKKRCCNQFIYGLEGVKNLFRCCCCRTLKCREVMKTFTKKQDPQEQYEALSDKSINEDDIEEQKEEKKTRDDVIIASHRSEEAKYYLGGNPVSLYCTNIPIIMGGRVSPWGGGRNNIAITDKDGNRISRDFFEDSISYNDGKLEFATFSSLLHVILSKSRRVYQDKGPFEFKFEHGEKTLTYMNIDGEFYKLTNLENITIEKADKYALNGSLKILVNDRENIFD